MKDQFTLTRTNQIVYHYLIQILILYALLLNVKTNGYNIMQGCQPLTTVYRIYCKWMKITLELHEFFK
jgi:hypothetical protein